VQFRHHFLGLALAALFATAGAHAAPLDSSASAKIDEAINTHYLAMDFRKAEGVLLGVIKACGNQCSNETLGRAWMYVGLVRGSGRQDLTASKEAFQTAKSFDPNVELDTALATPEVKAIWDSAVGSGAAPIPTPAPTTELEPVPAGALPGATTTSPPTALPGDGAGELECTPTVTEMESRRVVPVNCQPPSGARYMQLFYREFGGSSYQTVDMKRGKGGIQASIPCTATSLTGQLSLYVIALNANKQQIGQWGSTLSPKIIQVVDKTSAEPPSFPGEAAPPRCEEKVECPPGLPGCTSGGAGGWGDSCTPKTGCKEGLFCNSGTCEPAASCETDADCASGQCTSEGTCKMADASGGDEEDSGSSGKKPWKKHWIGLQIGGDLPIVSGNSVCTAAGHGDGFRCYLNGQETQAIQSANYKSGVSYASTRFLLSYDGFFFGPRVSLGVRAGYALTSTKPKFMPFHAEGRVTLWLVPMDRPSVKPFLHAGGGMEQINASLGSIPAQVNSSSSGYDAKLATYKVMGTSFAGGGLGLMIPTGSSGGLTLDLAVNYLFPSKTSGIALQPSLGYELGF